MARAQVTRESILVGAALALKTYGFKATTFDHIAAEVEHSRSAVLWHFRSKGELLTALVSPLLERYAALLDTAEASPERGRSRTLLTGIVDLYLDHRTVVEWLLIDISAYNEPGPMQGVAALDQRCRDLLAPTDDIEGQIRAAAALGALGRPLLALRDHDLVPYKRCLVDIAFGALHR